MSESIQRLRMLLPLLLLLVAIAGCPGFAAHGKVNGTVTLDDRPLKEGNVRFVPVDGKSQTASAKITDGKFTAAVPVGEMRVEFSAGKVVGKTKMYDSPDSPTVEDVWELIPERYNTKTELKIKVSRGTNEVQFRLKSKN